MKNFSKETVQTAKNLRLIDDTLFRLVASEPGACQEILRTLLGDCKLEVLSVTPQETMVSLHREICLDVLCQLGNGRFANI